MRKDVDDRKEEIIEWLSSGISRAEVCKRLSCKYDTLKSRLDKWGVQHKNKEGRGRPKFGARVNPEKFLKLDGPPIQSARLKKLLFRDDLKKEACERCGIIEWQGEPAPLELDHINGDRFDNRIENLQILCRNCHGLRANHAGRNRGNYN